MPKNKSRDKDVQEKLDLDSLRKREKRAKEAEERETDKIKKLNDYYKKKEEGPNGSQVFFQFFYK